jgi:hypothetical protein
MASRIFANGRGSGHAWRQSQVARGSSTMAATAVTRSKRIGKRTGKNRLFRVPNIVTLGNHGLPRASLRPVT